MESLELDNMASPDASSTVTWRSTLRDVPWKWRDLLIGIAPLVLLRGTVDLLGRPLFVSAPSWLWIPGTLVSMLWMLCFPLWIAHRRVGLPRMPRFQVFVIEGLFAALAVPAILITVFMVAIVLVRVLGEPSMGDNPLEQIAGSPNRFEVVALIVLATVVAPLAEETFFRGMLYNAFRQLLHPALGLVLQGVVFGLAHPFGLTARIVLSVIGTCFGAFYEWRKKLVASMLLHSAWNAVVLSFMFLLLSLFSKAPLLGVRVQPEKAGCLVSSVEPQSAAAEAGLQAGDVIIKVADQRVSDLRSIMLVLVTKQVGDVISVDFTRNGVPLHGQGTLRERPK